MRIEQIDIALELDDIKGVANQAFSTTPDGSLEDWFSFGEMVKTINENRGLCLKASDDSGQIMGMIHAQQESPINGKESLEKWVIIIAAVIPEFTSKSIGSKLLQKLEEETRKRGVNKMFVFTNKDDDKVINFYRKNGYEDAGWIKDYQYGVGNSAVFLLKYINRIQ